MNTVRVTIGLRDKYGKVFAMVFWFPDTLVSPDHATVTGLIALLNAMLASVCVFVELTKSSDFVGGASLTASHAAVNSKLRVFGLGSAEMKRPGSWSIPGVKLAVLKADKRTFDPTLPEYEALDDAIAAVGTNKAGTAYLGILRGYRYTMRKRQQR